MHGDALVHVRIASGRRNAVGWTLWTASASWTHQLGQSHALKLDSVTNWGQRTGAMIPHPDDAQNETLVRWLKATISKTRGNTMLVPTMCEELDAHVPQGAAQSPAQGTTGNRDGWARTFRRANVEARNAIAMDVALQRAAVPTGPGERPISGGTASAIKPLRQFVPRRHHRRGGHLDIA